MLGELALVFCYGVEEIIVGNKMNVRGFTVVNVKARGVLDKT